MVEPMDTRGHNSPKTPPPPGRGERLLKGQKISAFLSRASSKRGEGKKKRPGEQPSSPSNRTTLKAEGHLGPAVTKRKTRRTDAANVSLLPPWGLKKEKEGRKKEIFLPKKRPDRHSSLSHPSPLHLSHKKKGGGGLMTRERVRVRLFPFKNLGAQEKERKGEGGVAQKS